VSVTKVPAQLEAALVREALLKKQVAELQAENAKLQAGVAMWRANARAEAEVCLKLGAENAKLQAELDDLNSPVQLSEWQKLQAEIAEMKAELHGTVTTEYHDQIVAEAMQLIAQLKEDRDFLWKAWFGRYRRPPWDTGSEVATEPEK